jgi:hypothetical protein
MTATIQWRACKLLPLGTCLAATFLLAACQAAPLPAGDARTAGWRADLETLVTARENNHPDPWHGIDRARYIAEVDAVSTRVPELNDDELLVEITRLAAMPTWNGRDGHGGIYPWGEGTFDAHLYPLRLWHFSDGLFVTDALPPYDDLVGARIISVNDHDVDEILAAVGPLVPRDNEQQLLSHGPRLIVTAEVLHGLGFIDDPLASVDIMISHGGSSSRRVEVEPVPMQQYEGWAGGHHSMSPPARPTGPPWIRQLNNEIWWEYQPETRTAYVQYNFVGSGVAAVAKEVGARLAQGDVDRLVVDVRHNPGGDNTTYGPLLTFLRSPEVNQPGRLYVIMGRATFSAAGNFVTEVERSTSAILVGENLGSSPNMYGDSIPLELEHSGLIFRVAPYYIEKSHPDDPRITIEPDIAVPPRSADYFGDRDPAMDAIAGTAG